MSDWQIDGHSSVKYYDSNVTAHASTHTKGSYSELTSSIPIDCSSLIIITDAWSTSNLRMLVDLSVGGGGSEIVKIENLCFGTSNNGGAQCQSIFLPLRINQGQRVSLRCQCNTGGAVTHITSMFSSDNWIYGFSGVDTFGATTASTRGTSIDPGGVAGTFTAYSVVSASTTRTYQGLIVGWPYWGNTAYSSGTWQFEIAKGAAGSEQTIISNQISGGAYDDFHQPMHSQFTKVTIPSGTRLAVRAKSSITDATDRILDYIIYCFY